MPSDTPDIALLTERRYSASTAAADDWYLINILHDDRLLQDALMKMGWPSTRVDWAAQDVDWTRFQCAVFRTTWDYFDRISEFNDWLRRIERQTRLCNEASLIRWNLDKHYLADLESRGIPIVPTRFIPAGSILSLSDLLEETGWMEAVIKPCISGAARHTYRVHHRNAAGVQSKIQPLLWSESFLLQPFLADVQQTGEDTLIFLDGMYTHAVRKVPSPGDYRVQDDHGGTVHPLRPTFEQIELAERTMETCHPPPAYGRVDMVRDPDGQWRVMELELIEPELWLRNSPESAEKLAQAIVRVASR
ncbi:MAG: ATP-grasp domain-containing protein [Bacteroidota bacterium]